MSGAVDISARPALPLAVDLDGTLLRSDSLQECALVALRRSPWLLLLCPFWLLAGRAALKRRLAARCLPAAELLPYREEVLAWLRAERASGRRVVLATAADARIAHAVAAHLGCFDEVIASDGAVNLAGGAKGAALAGRFGERGFAYAGDAARDEQVWRRAGAAVVVGGASLRALAQRHAPVERAFAPASAPLALVAALRPHQWLKNLLVFLPLLTAHALAEGAAFARSGALFAAWCAVASAIYLLNDLLDVEADRRHPDKRARPFAAGAAPPLAGVALAPALLVAGLGAAWWAAPGALATLAAYAAAATAYSWTLKRIAMVDAFVLAGLYVLRIVGGGFACGHAVSVWLLAFASFLFLGLAFCKRVGELSARGASARRGYLPEDLPLLAMVGVGSGVAATVVFTLYLKSSDIAPRLYGTPELLWGVAPLLLLWQCRLWLAAWRGRLHHDPLVHASRDPGSWLIAALIALCYGAATIVR